jgi:RimJ/RimL family protein N-acetyltransferase
MEIRGAKVIIRDKRIEDAWNEYEWRVDVELSKLDAAPPITMGFDEFCRIFNSQFNYPTPWSKRMSIDTFEGLYIGNCMYYDIDAVNKEAEIGIMIGNRDFWGQGYGFDVMVTLIDHIFSSSSLKRLYLHTLEWNERARCCFEKVGMQVVKTVRRSGFDFYLMDMTRNLWEEKRDEKLRLRSDLSDPNHTSSIV